LLLNINVFDFFQIFSANPVNPFKNPFQAIPQEPQYNMNHQQSHKNWTIPDSKFINGFGSPLSTNDFSNGYYYVSNMSSGIISQQSAFSGKADFGNPFMVRTIVVFFNSNSILYSR